MKPSCSLLLFKIQLGVLKKAEMCHMEGDNETIKTVEETSPKKITKNKRPERMYDHLEYVRFFPSSKICFRRNSAEFIILRHVFFNAVVRIMKYVAFEMFHLAVIFHDEFVVWIITAPIGHSFIDETEFS